MKIRRSLLSRLREVILFAAIGVLNTAVDFAVLNLLILLTHHDQGLWLLPLDAIAFLAGLINSYVLNGRFTFRNSGSGDPWRFIRFVAVNGVGLIINSLIVWALSPLLGVIISPLLAMNVSKVVATLFSLCWNYFAMKYWIFRREKTVEVVPYVFPDDDENGILPVGDPSGIESEIKSAV
jgi:putative flippase GtrA